MGRSTLLEKASAAFILLGCISSSYADNYDLGSRSFNDIERRQSIPPTLPGTWKSLGCITDGTPRALSGDGQAGPGNTIETCIAFCESKGFIYAGTEYSAECFCGNVIGSTGHNTTASECNMACSGDPQELCGGPLRINLFWNGKPPPPPPVIPPTIGEWVSLGCHTDLVNGVRTLAVGTPTSGPVTLESCTTACFNGGYRFSGAEYSGECYCGQTLAPGSGPAPLSDCNMLCAGNSSEFCGGPNRLSLYNFTGTLGGGGGDGGGGGPPPNNGVGPVLDGLPTGWSYNACWIDNLNGRIFSFGFPGSTTNTVENCITRCQGQNYKVAGTEYSSECFCSNSLVNGAALALEADCNMGCSGSPTEACGGPNRLSVYSQGAFEVLPLPTALKTNLPGKWEYQGCLREPETVKMFPYKIFWPGNNTALACMNQCAAFGFPASGVEYGEECYCGDITDVAAHNGVFGAESECDIPCPGDPRTLCGSGNRLTTYYWSGGLNNWRKPANIGRYEFLVPGVLVPLLATVGINNKVTFLEKFGTGFPNTTGAYELDLTLVKDFNHAWREMHLKTDVFCSGSVILPDKVGRQLNVGGWSLESLYGVRMYIPDGSPGVNGTNDWQENYYKLKLQRARWYPTAAILSNGSVLIMGGEIGSNDKPQPNLELLPKPAGGDTVIELDWLARTDPNNLYPFITILPSKNIFVGYYNEARILNPTTFATVKTLPNIPGAVNDFTAGRTYPLEGASVPLPQRAPYTDPLQILICGGSTIGGGWALDSCVTIAPEAANPTWTLERMPSRRVLPCMVSLPDGTVMIMNGALHGVAGFGLAEDPNFNAVLYDPSQPVGSRFAILNNTIVPRMYHSEATLLPDGRILISGSDPQTNWPDGTVRYPEEFRIEAYIPPYLNQGFKQPTFTLANKDWAYGVSYTITNVQLFQGTTGTMRVSLVAATSSTHGNTMGARTIFPAFSCSGTSCTIVAPPNSGVSPPGWHQLFILDGPTPSHSQWVRIGGDPSQLGNWPNIAGFTTPGM